MGERTMREYVDAIQGAVAWDLMHDKIAIGRMDWEMPPLDVDGHEIRLFPGTNRDVTVEAVRDEIRKVLSSMVDHQGSETK